MAFCGSGSVVTPNMIASMGLDNLLNQNRRFTPGQSLEFPENSFGKFHGGLHIDPFSRLEPRTKPLGSAVAANFCYWRSRIEALPSEPCSFA
jgi:hypothetical protein